MRFPPSVFVFGCLDAAKGTGQTPQNIILRGTMKELRRYAADEKTRTS